MKKEMKLLVLGLCLLVAFGVFTLLVMKVDVQAIGPEGSKVGLATINGAFRDLVGHNTHIYDLTEGMGYGVLMVAAAFCLLGLSQMLKNKSLKMDRELWYLVALYAVVMACYVAFEFVVINCRPVLMEGKLEASYPSSHTMLAVCIMGSALIYLKKRIPCARCRRIPALLGTLLMLAVVLGRTVSGVHWLTDILASLLLSGGLLALYAAAIEKEEKVC